MNGLTRSFGCSRRVVSLGISILFGGLVLTLLPSARAFSAEAEWIWSPLQEKLEVPEGQSCYFRKTFVVKEPEAGHIAIAADDQFELFVNGRKLGSGGSTKKMLAYDISRVLTRGQNLVAIHVTNRTGPTGALVARLTVKERDGGWNSFSTSDSWKTSIEVLPLWNTLVYNESRWRSAQSFGVLGETSPWDIQPTSSDPRSKKVAPKPSSVQGKQTRKIADPDDADLGFDAPFSVEDLDDDEAVRDEPIAKPEARARIKDDSAIVPPVSKLGQPEDENESYAAERYRVHDEFRVDRIADGNVTGSLLAFTFNEFGVLIAAQEGGPLISLSDTNQDGVFDQARVVCDSVQNVQGLMSLSGDLYVTGDGPSGAALYRLSDEDHDGTYEGIRALVQFDDPMGEHGAHGVALGPDGLIYVVAGNHTKIKRDIEEGSPYSNSYEGDLLTPRYEDPGGHAVGVKAPGGVVFRTDTEGSAVQLVAGGIRNAYDLAFNHEGELFTVDSDMEADEGTTWYRPTQVLHVIPGGEYGWRSGWANWPEYFVDSVKPVGGIGPGSPTGCVVYDHFMFPSRFHGSLFVGDWAQGRILSIRLKPNGASYTTDIVSMVEGQPLNVTDLEVGSDGALYFVTGGRGTSGGVFRLSWKGQVPERVLNLGERGTAVTKSPQLQSAATRQSLAQAKRELGEDWDKELNAIALNPKLPAEQRTRALDVLQLYGPEPTETMLSKLAGGKNERVRAKAVELLGQYSSEESRSKLAELLSDRDAIVRRKACEAILRAGHHVTFANLEGNLASDDHAEAFAARRLLERQPIDEWESVALESKYLRAQIQASLAMAIAAPSEGRALAWAKLFMKRMEGFVSDRDFVDILRTLEVHLHRSKTSPDSLAFLREHLRDEFPAGDSLINRELIRLLAYLQETSIMDRYLEYLNGEASEPDRLHVAMSLRFMSQGWTSERRMAWLAFMEQAQSFTGGSAMTRYVINATKDVVSQLTPEESQTILAQGEKWPNAALGCLYRLPNQLDEATVDQLISLDKKLSAKNEAGQRLKIGIIAVLARSGDEKSLVRLRKLWEAEPERRQAIAMGLALRPGGDNWPYIVRSLPLLEKSAAPTVLNVLREVPQRPAEPEAYRNVIILGLRLGENGADKSIALLEHWVGEKMGVEGDTPAAILAAWQQWYARTYPNAPEANLPIERADAKWSYDRLYELLIKDHKTIGDPKNGPLVFEKAKCAKCHRIEGVGETMGPDLSTLAKRFSRKEILESVCFPSHVVSDQYASKTVLTTNGKTYQGIVAAGAVNEWVILQASGEKITLLKSEVEEILPSKVSAMPEGLLEPLSEEEIKDLFAYLSKAGKSVRVAKKKKKAKEPTNQAETVGPLSLIPAESKTKDSVDTDPTLDKAETPEKDEVEAPMIILR